MTQKIINIGTVENDGTGDTLRGAFANTNNNFTELYSGIVAGNAYAVQVGAASNNWANSVTLNYSIAVGAAGNSYTVQVGAASNTWANTKLANTANVSFAGPVIVPNTLILGQNELHSFSAISDGTTNQQHFDEFQMSTWRSSSYFISMEDAITTQCININVTHDDSNAFISLYGNTVGSNGAAAGFSVSANSLLNIVRVNTTPTHSSTLVSYKVLRTLTRVG